MRHRLTAPKSPLIWFFDPGQDTGWAATWAGRLIGCGLITVGYAGALDMSGPESTRSLGTVPDSWIEKPEYRREKNKVDPNDLIALGLKVGRIQEYLLMAGSEPEIVTPSYWKGAIPKEIHHDRVREELTAEDLATIALFMLGIPEGKQHNVWDAVAGAIWVSKKRGYRK